MTTNYNSRFTFFIKKDSIILFLVFLSCFFSNKNNLYKLYCMCITITIDIFYYLYLSYKEGNVSICLKNVFGYIFAFFINIFLLIIIFLLIVHFNTSKSIYSLVSNKIVYNHNVMYDIRKKHFCFSDNNCYFVVYCPNYYDSCSQDDMIYLIDRLKDVKSIKENNGDIYIDVVVDADNNLQNNISDNMMMRCDNEIVKNENNVKTLKCKHELGYYDSNSQNIYQNIYINYTL